MAAQILFVLLLLVSLHPIVTAPWALLMGILLSLSIGNPFATQSRQWTPRLLSLSIIGLGAGMNLVVVGRVGAHGILYTAVGIIGTLCLGLWLGSRLSLPKSIATLIAAGTAICGGSAIAAVAPVIRAKSEETSIALAVVFVLNAIALMVFPFIGHALQLSEVQFGLWSALAIHDTSSVVGASMQFGRQALEVGTTVKLARALWIIPVTLFFAWQSKKMSLEAGSAKPKRPWFILGFLIMAALMTWIPDLAPYGHIIEDVAKRLLVVTLFLIGCGLSRENLKKIGIRPLIQAVSLWIIVASITLVAIQQRWIQL
jgi:uncharacterized integral membrane protein (TIGR00698 family)